QHIPTNVSIQHESAVTHINLSRNIRDQVILSRRADGCTTKEIKLKLLAPFNGISKEQLEQHNNYIRDDTGPWTILHRLSIEELKKSESVLYYQQEDRTVTSNSSQHYYQLTVSDNMWLEQARDYGSFCFSIDAKYDLNNDKAPTYSCSYVSRRFNQGRLKVLQNNVLEVQGHKDFLYYQKNGYDIFLPIEKQIIEKDPFRPSELSRQRRTVIDLPEINNNNTTIDNNVDEDINLSVLNEDSPTILVEDYQYQDAKLVPNIDGISESLSTSSIQFKLNNVEQSMDWNRKEFAKECKLRNIRLDDDDTVNAIKIIS
ncbi:38182_t:CDS:2, partial [Gigaspora margarita]